AAIIRREVYCAHGRALAPQVLGQAVKGLPDTWETDDVAVEHQADFTPLQSNKIPISEKRCPSLSVLALEIPHSEQADGSDTLTNEGIGLFLPFGDPQRKPGACEVGLTARWTVQAHTGTRRDEILPDPAAGLRLGAV